MIRRVVPPKRTRLSYKDKAAIIEAAKKGRGKKAVREKMMSEYQIGRTAYYYIFRDSRAKSCIGQRQHWLILRVRKLRQQLQLELQLSDDWGWVDQDLAAEDLCRSPSLHQSDYGWDRHPIPL